MSFPGGRATRVPGADVSGRRNPGGLPLQRQSSQHRSPMFLAIAGTVAVLFFVLFVVLGTWQVKRRAWKLDLIARVEQRVHTPATPAPNRAQWSNVTAATDEYRHVTASGTFLDASQTLVQAVTDLGAGYWVLTPLQTGDGTIVLVNRGFISADDRNRVQPAAASASSIAPIRGDPTSSTSDVAAQPGVTSLATASSTPTPAPAGATPSAVPPPAASVSAIAPIPGDPTSSTSDVAAQPSVTSLAAASSTPSPLPAGATLPAVPPPAASASSIAPIPGNPTSSTSDVAAQPGVTSLAAASSTPTPTPAPASATLPAMPPPAGATPPRATVTGLLRMTEPGGAFLRHNNPAANQWYSRDVRAIATARGLTRVAPYFIDAEGAPHDGGSVSPLDPTHGLDSSSPPNSAHSAGGAPPRLPALAKTPAGRLSTPEAAEPDRSTTGGSTTTGAPPASGAPASGTVSPTPGLTVIHFHNSHLVYAITWYTLALMVAIAIPLGLRKQ